MLHGNGEGELNCNPCSKVFRGEGNLTVVLGYGTC